MLQYNDRPASRQSGFTLLEVLIAVTITGLIGMGTYRLLSSTLRTQDHMATKTEKLQQLQRTMAFLSRDLEQLGSRSVRNEYGDQEFAISNRNNLYWLEMTRLGWRNPLNEPRSDVQRVSYELRDDTLVRDYWKVLDRAQDSQPVSQDLLKGVDSLQVRFMDSKDQWHEEWPTDDILNQPSNIRFSALPKAVEITIKHKEFGTLTRLFDVPGFYDPTAVQNSNSPNSNTSQNGSQDNQGVNNNGAEGGNATPAD